MLTDGYDLEREETVMVANKKGFHHHCVDFQHHDMLHKINE